MTEEELFHAALAQAPADRAAFLARACSGNDSLRAAVEALLAAHEAPGSLLNQPLFRVEAKLLEGDVAATQVSGLAEEGKPVANREHPASSNNPLNVDAAPTAKIDNPRIVSAGVVIGGRYTLQEKIGEGGMGEVWVAKQTEPVKRKVALKLIKTGMDSRAVLQRFEQERQALALMDHPHIARVLDGGMTPTGQPFFVMELVNGLPLSKFCDELRLSLRARLELFVPICQAVQHAHQKGIVHRDLKPANILVTMIDGKPVPKVIDFGVAKATSGKLTAETMSTGFGAVVGTLEYMAPEQAGFSGEDVDTRADIYSLGVILYELLTGLRPIDSKRLKQAALNEMIRMIREEEPSKPSTRVSTDESLPSLAAMRQIEPRKLTALLRGELDWVVMKCLEKQRDRRYETANALVRDVQRYLADEAVEARPPSTGYRFRKYIRRHKGQVIAASLVLLALTCGVIGTSLGMLQASQAAKSERLAKEREALRADGERKAKEEAQAARDQEAEERDYAEAIAQFVVDDFLALTSVEGQREHHGEGLSRDATLRDLLDRAARKLDDRKDLDPRTEAELDWIIGVSYRATGEPALAIPFLERSVKLRRETFGQEAPLTLDAQNSLALAYASAGHFEKAQPLFEETITLRRNTLGPDHVATLESMHHLAAFYLRVWKEDLALLLIEDTLARRKRTLGPDHADTLESMGVLAQVLGTKGNYQRAVQTMEDALRIAEATTPSDPDTLLSVKSDLASVLAMTSAIDRALALYQEVFESYRSTYESGHSATLSAMNNLASAYESAGKVEQAVALFEEAYRIESNQYGPTHPRTLVGMSNLGRVLVASDQFDRGLALLEKTVELHLERFGPDHPDTLTSQNNLGVAYLGSESIGGDSRAALADKALPLFEELMRSMETRFGPTHPDTLQCMVNLVMANRQAGRKQEAIALAEKNVQLMKAMVGPDHPRTFTAMNNLALTYADARMVDKALEVLKETLRLSQAKLGADHISALNCKYNLAMAHQDAGELNKALPMLEETYQQVHTSLGVGHSFTRRIMHSLADMRLSQRQFDSAVPVLEEVLEWERSEIGADDPETMASIKSLGVCYWNLKQYDKSVPLFEELYQLKTAKYGKDHLETLDIAANLGVNYRSAGRLQEAISLLEEVHVATKSDPSFRWILNPLMNSYVDAGDHAKVGNLLLEELPLARTRLPDDSPPLAAMLAQISYALLLQSRWTEAEELLRESLEIREKYEPDAWTTFSTQSMLGGALLGQNKLADAEPLLLSGYEGMKRHEATMRESAKIRLGEALDRLIEFSTIANKPDDVKKWQEERNKYPPAPTAPTDGN